MILSTDAALAADLTYESAFTRHWDDVFRLALAGTNDRAAAEDQAQEAFLRRWRSRASRLVAAGGAVARHDHAPPGYGPIPGARPAGPAARRRDHDARSVHRRSLAGCARGDGPPLPHRTGGTRAHRRRGRGAEHGWGRPLRQAAGVGMAAVVLVAGTAWLLPRPSTESLAVGASPSPGACPVTHSDGRDWHGSGEPPTGAFGAQGLVVPIMPDGTILVRLAQVAADGVLWDKLGVWRDPQASGSLTLEGRRLDGEAPPMIADIPTGYGETGLQMTSVGFPAEGCWELTVRSGDAELRWVVRVERASVDDPGGCPVTMPDGVHTDAWPATALDHGADGIVTALAPGGVVLIPGGEGDGDIGWRDTLFAIAEPACGPLTVTGHLLTLDPAAGSATSSPGVGPGSLQVAYPDGRSGDGPLRVDLGFPTEGCWEITARAGDAIVTYVTWVELRVVSLGAPVPSAAVATSPVPSGP